MNKPFSYTFCILTAFYIAFVSVCLWVISIYSFIPVVMLLLIDYYPGLADIPAINY